MEKNIKDKIPPNNTESEQSLLGCLLIDNKQYQEVKDIIIPEDFYSHANFTIYQFISSMLECGKEVDIITLSAALKTEDKLDVCGGMVYIASLADSVPSSAMAKNYAEIIKENALLRTAVKVGNDLIQAAYSTKPDLSVVIPEIQKRLVTIVTRNTSKMTRRTIQMEVDEWVRSNESNNVRYNSLLLSLHSCYLDLGYKTPEEKASCRMALKRLCEKGILEAQGGKSGLYKLLDGTTEEIDYENASDEQYDWDCPLETHRYVKIYPGSTILIAGESNSGKTAYCLNIAKRYMDTRPIWYFSSDMEDVELRVRLDHFNLPLEAWKNVHFINRQTNFADVVRPNELNIVDYLEVNRDFYEIAGLIRDIKNKVQKGLVIIAIQKHSAKELGLGGEMTKNLSRLYLTMSPGKAKIIKGKMWASYCNPDGMTLEYKLVEGSKFIVSKSWLKDGAAPRQMDKE